MMGEMMKKMMLTGVGAVLFTKDRIEDMVSEMVHQGTISQEEGNSLMQELINKANQERSRMNQRVRTEIQSYMKGSGLVTETEVENLRQEVTKLHQRIAQLENQFNAAPGDSGVN